MGKQEVNVYFLNYIGVEDMSKYNIVLDDNANIKIKICQVISETNALRTEITNHQK
jgi:hypothetical protein